MLKKIPVAQAELGMYLHALEGPWLHHPFWRTRFLLEDPQDLRQLRAAALDGVWIDVSKGADLPASGEPATTPRPPSPPPPAGRGALASARAAAAPTAAPAARQASTDMAEELSRAKAVCEQGRARVTALFKEARLGQAISTDACREVVSDITDSVFRQADALISLARIKTTDDYTYMHSVAVCALMVALGQQLGLSREQCEAAGVAGLFHDIGKARIPLAILNKPGKLSDEEFAVVQQHPQLGFDMLGAAAGMAGDTLDVARHHHEKFDGSGYPHRLAGEDISLLARMGAVCDVYDAITSNRPYKAGWDPAESIARMASWQGHFDPMVFKAFVKSLGIYPVGSLVRLQSGKLAVVVQTNPQALAAPLVKVFFSTNSQMPITPQLIDLARSQDRITGREDPAKWRFAHLNELWAEGALTR